MNKRLIFSEGLFLSYVHYINIFMTVTPLFKTQSNRSLNKNEQSALHLSKDLAVIRQRILAGDDINAYDKFTRTPLSYWRGSEIAQILVDNDARVDDLIRMEGEFYPLTQMHICDDVEWAKFLMDNGYQKDMRDGFERTALSKVRNPDVIQYLLDNDFDLYANDQLDRTAFHNNDCYDALGCLLRKHGNGPLPKDRSGLDPILSARTLDEVRLFSQHGGDLKADDEYGMGLANKFIVGFGFIPDDDEIWTFNKDDFRARLNELRDIGVDIFKADRIHGNKLHHWATVQKIYPLMELLVDEYGFHPDDRNADGDSCVHLGADDLINTVAFCIFVKRIVKFNCCFAVAQIRALKIVMGKRRCIAEINLIKLLH